MRFFVLIAAGLSAMLGLAHAAEPRTLAPREEDGDVGMRTCDNDNDRRNNPGLAGPYEIKICYDAFIVNFAGRPTAGEPWRIPRFVAYRVEKRPTERMPSSERPSRWFSVPELADEGLAADDKSYRFAKIFVDSKTDWYQRGHLAPKTLAERHGPKAAIFSHTTANAVPQLGQFNRTGWLDLECRTGAWAQRADDLWVVAGPVFTSSEPKEWLRAPNQTSPRAQRFGDPARPLAVAIPDKLFKIVVRRDGEKYQALAFLFAQTDKRYSGPLKHLEAESFLETVAHIEKLTGLQFFESVKGLRDAKALKGRADNPGNLWPQKAADFERGCRSFAKDQS